MVFDLEKLSALENTLSAADGLPISELRSLLSVHFKGDRNSRDVDDYRLGRRHWKKLRDEVVPTSDFLSTIGFLGSVRFPLDNHAPDVWIIPEGHERIGLEVTRALGRTDYRLAEELVQKGAGRGFLGLQDDAPNTDFDEKLGTPREMHSPSQALETVRDGIVACLTNKTARNIAECGC